MGWLSTTDHWIDVAQDKTEKVLYEGKISVSQTVTRKELSRTYPADNLPAFRPPSSDLAGGTETGSSEWTVERGRNIRVKCVIATTVRELRGLDEQTAKSYGTPQTAQSLSQSVTLSAYDSGYIVTGWDGQTLTGYRITAPAESVTMTFPECNGTSKVYSARRVNEACGWTVTETVSVMTTTISQF